MHRERPGEMSSEDVLALIRKIRDDIPLKQIAFSGGEPMLRKDLSNLARKLSDEGLDCAVITNGSHLNGYRLKGFPEGSIFEVPLFSADALLHDKIAGSRCFEQVTEGITKLRKYGCFFVLAFIVTSLNAKDTARTISLAIALGAEAVMLNRVNISRHFKNKPHAILPSAADLRESLHQANDAAAAYGISVAVSVPIPACIIDISEFPNLHFGWCPRGNEDSYYTVGVGGMLRPCNHTSVILGDLNNNSFSDIINSQRSKDFWAPVPSECLDCTNEYKDLCRGGCPAAADEYYGTSYKMDPYVELSGAT